MVGPLLRDGSLSKQEIKSPSVKIGSWRIWNGDNTKEGGEDGSDNNQKKK